MKEKLDRDAKFRKHTYTESNWTVRAKNQGAGVQTLVELKLNGLSPGTCTVLDWFSNAEIELKEDKSVLIIRLQEDKDEWETYRHFLLEYVPSYYNALLMRKIEVLILDPKNWTGPDAGGDYYCHLKGLDIPKDLSLSLYQSLVGLLDKHGFKDGKIHIERCGPQLRWMPDRTADGRNSCIIS